MNATEPMVAIAFDLNFRHAAEIFSGVSDYIGEARLNWRLVPLNFGFEARLVELADSGQLTAAIGTFVSDNWLDQLTGKGVIAVNMFNFSQIKSIPNIAPDDDAIGKAAAEHLLAQKARRFAFLGADSIYQTRLRATGFRAGLPNVANCHELTGGPLLAEQIYELASGNRPLGVFCSDDRFARECILAAQDKGLQCGRDLLVVGVGDDPSESIFAGLGISSFKQPVREAGYAAAQTLHELIESPKASANTQRLLPSRLIVRESSMPSPVGSAQIAQRAANLLRENLANPHLEIASIAQSMGVSRRVLELIFKNQLNTSPYQLLSKARLELAQNLLKTTQLAITKIGIRCGYPELYHFSAWFKKQTGLSPKAFRLTGS